VTVIHKLSQRPELTSTSIFLEAIILSEQHQRIAARCFEDIVVYDYRKGKKSQMEPFMVTGLGSVFDQQVSAQDEAAKAVAVLQSRLQRLLEA
jgi:hypothetical protein